MMMPGMDGLTFLERLRANCETQSIPVILLTAKVEFTDSQRISTLGLAGAISKPFDPYTVVEQIATFLGWMVGK
jgi:CheY-like chemotaxis protein